MTTNAPDAAPAPSKIIPLRPERWHLVMEGMASDSTSERARHFLKITLPAVPIASFMLTFLLSYALVASAATSAGHAINPLPALLSALAVASVTGALCRGIYAGFCQISGLDRTPPGGE